mgnify:CR=1 FL=1
MINRLRKEALFIAFTALFASIGINAQTVGSVYRIVSSNTGKAVTNNGNINADAQVVAIHAGLECGLLSEKLPGLDCVSIGPEMHDIHTSREKLEIASTKRTWEFLLEILKAL